jgi:hypothetical protein
MRRRRSSVASFAAAALALLTATESRAQNGLAKEGAAFLLIPVGARALGMGQAVVADQPGTESVWWNPAGLARAERREVAVHHYESVVGKGDVVSLSIPSSLLGVITASVYILDYGAQGLTDQGGATVASIDTRNLAYAATYSTAVGSRINAGVTFKIVQLRVACTGTCVDLTPIDASGSAVDVGVQYDAAGLIPASIGVAVRNLGPKLQVNDKEQEDPLPTRIQIGALYRVSPLRYAKDVDLRVSGDVIDELTLTSPAVRVGADLAWRKQAHLRAGYVFKEYANSEQYGPSLGLGLTAANLSVDIARMFEGFSRGVDTPPTYVSLRYLF